MIEKIEVEENINIENLNNLIQKVDEFNENMYRKEDDNKRTKCKTRLNNLRHLKTGRREYRKCQSQDGKLFGRYICSNSCQFLKGKFIKYICKNDVVDIDLTKCHPNILMKYCIDNKIDCNNLKAFVLNPDEVMKKEGFNKESLQFCVFDKMFKGKNTFLKILNTEIYDKILPHLLKNEEFSHINEYSKINAKRKNNIEGSFLANVCQELESRILVKVIEFMNSYDGIKVEILKHDGIIVSPSSIVDNNFLNELNSFIFKEFNYHYIFRIKPFKTLEFKNSKKEEEEIIYITKGDVIDNTINDIFIYTLDKLGKKVKRIGKTLYIKTEDNCWYINVKNNELQNLVVSILKKSKYVNFIKSSLSTIIKMLVSEFNINENYEDNDLLKKFVSTTKGKLCFKNGVFNLYTKELIPWEQCDNIYTDKIIDYDFVKIEDDFADKMFDDFFLGNKIEKTEFLQIISLSLAGEPQKRWIKVTGPRDCGKSTLLESLKISFRCKNDENYIGQFNADSLIKKTSNTGDIEKQNAWKKSFTNTRLCYSSEINVDEKTVLQGGDIKSLSSGNDSIKFRVLYENPITAYCTALPVLLVNQFANISPQDTYKNGELVEVKVHYTAGEIKPSDTCYKKMNQNILSEIEESINKKIGFINLISDYYIMAKNNKFSNNANGSYFNKCLLECVEVDESNLQIDDVIKNMFKHSSNEGDVLSCNQIKLMLEKDGKKFDQKMIGMVLKNLGFKPIKKNGGKRYYSEILIRDEYLKNKEIEKQEKRELELPSSYKEEEEEKEEIKQDSAAEEEIDLGDIDEIINEIKIE